MKAKKRKYHMVVGIAAGPFVMFGSGRMDILSLPEGESLRIQAKGGQVSVTIEGRDGVPREIAISTPVLLRCASLEMLKLKTRRAGK